MRIMRKKLIQTIYSHPIAFQYGNKSGNGNGNTSYVFLLLVTLSPLAMRKGRRMSRITCYGMKN